MSDMAIRVEKLSKQYRIGAKQSTYKTLRDTLTDTFKMPLRWMGNRLRGQPGLATEVDEIIWALRDVSRRENRRQERRHRAYPTAHAATTVALSLSTQPSCNWMMRLP